MDTTNSVVRSAKSFFAGTLLSRFSGLFRDIAMAMSFGSSPEIASFFVAYRLANLFRRLLGEGNLNAAFVPHYSEMQERAPYFYRDVLFSMAVLLLVGVLMIEGLLFALAPFVSSDWVETLHLVMWMVPGLFFICLFGLNSALLQCHKKFFLPAVAPVAFNLIWIGSALWATDVRVLAITITLAFFGQWFVTSFEGFGLLPIKEWLSPRLFSADFKRIIKPMVLGILGIGAVQFNSALDPIFARLADLKGPAYLWYAIRVQQLPVALLGIALTGALLPPLSRTKDPEKRREFLNHALGVAMRLMLICTFGIFALSEVGINLLFGHGDFSGADVLETSKCLWGYAAGLVPSVFVLILAANCYAAKNYRLPTIASFVSVGVNLFCNALFVFGFGWGAVSVAIATSLSSLVNCVLLSKGAFDTGHLYQFLKLGFCCLSACLVTMSAQEFWMGPLSHNLLLQVVQFSFLALVFLSSLFVFTWKQGLKQLFQEIF